MHSFTIVAVLYILAGTILCEICTYFDRKRGKPTTKRQYTNLVFFWPIVLYVAFVHPILNRK